MSLGLYLIVLKTEAVGNFSFNRTVGELPTLNIGDKYVPSFFEDFDFVENQVSYTDSIERVWM